LYEFAFVSKKLGEEPKSIEDNLEFIADIDTLLMFIIFFFLKILIVRGS